MLTVTVNAPSIILSPFFFQQGVPMDTIIHTIYHYITIHYTYPPCNSSALCTNSSDFSIWTCFKIKLLFHPMNITLKNMCLWERVIYVLCFTYVWEQPIIWSPTSYRLRQWPFRWNHEHVIHLVGRDHGLSSYEKTTKMNLESILRLETHCAVSLVQSSLLNPGNFSLHCLRVIVGYLLAPSGPRSGMTGLPAAAASTVTTSNDQRPILTN